MAKKSFSVEQIIHHLGEADVLVSQGQTVGEVCRRIGVSEQSYCRWRKEYGGLGGRGPHPRENSSVGLAADQTGSASALCKARRGNRAFSPLVIRERNRHTPPYILEPTLDRQTVIQLGTACVLLSLPNLVPSHGVKP